MLSAAQNTSHEYLNIGYKEHKETFVSAPTSFFSLLFNSPHAQNPPPISSPMQDSVLPSFLKLGQERKQRLLFRSKSEKRKKKKIPSCGTKTEVNSLCRHPSPCALSFLTSADVADRTASNNKSANSSRGRRCREIR